MSNKGNNTIYIKPAKPGAKVHLEGKGREFLPEEGAEVDRSNYWVRRIKDVSVVVMKDDEVAALKKKLSAETEARKKAAIEAAKSAEAVVDKKE